MTFTSRAVWIDHDTWEARLKWLRDHQIKFHSEWARNEYGDTCPDIDYTFENEDDFVSFTLTWL